jgi:tRNA dimethylallyltransferase
VGPTAIGKTALSLDLANVIDCEIVNMDSMQVYRYMDIGTAKATIEERQRVPHHLIDIVNPDENYDAERFVNDACMAIKGILTRKKTPLITGGTGLYLRALTEGLFAGGMQYPEIRAQLKKRLAIEGNSKLHEELYLCDHISAKRIHINDTHRLIRALEIFHGTGVPWSHHLQIQEDTNKKFRFTHMLAICLTCERPILYERINRRCSYMLDAGLELEVQGLLQSGYGSQLKPMMSIGYRHTIKYIEGTWNKYEMEQFLSRDTRRYAKRQLTWFLNSAKDMLYFDVSEPSKIMRYIAAWHEQHG